MTSMQLDALANCLIINDEMLTNCLLMTQTRQGVKLVANNVARQSKLIDLYNNKIELSIVTILIKRAEQLNINN